MYIYHWYMCHFEQANLCMLMKLILFLISHHLDFASYPIMAILCLRALQSVRYISEPAYTMLKQEIFSLGDK